MSRPVPLQASWRVEEWFRVENERVLGLVELRWGPCGELDPHGDDWGPRAFLALSEDPDGLRAYWLTATMTQALAGPLVGEA